MKNHTENIHPIFDRLLQRGAKEAMLQQRSLALWMTGLSGSGKSTIGQHLEAKLHKDGYLTQMLDGDNIRSGLNKNLSFTESDRLENIRRIAEVSKLFVDCGIITINSFISPTKEIRAYARDIIGSENFHEIYINTPLEICESRDVKGLYAKVRKGEIKNFTGIDSPYEAPENPALEVKTERMSIEASVEEIYQFILPLILMK